MSGFNKQAEELVTIGRTGMVEVRDFQNKQGYYSKWYDYDLKEEHLKDKRVIYVFLSDNVLDEDAWTIAKVNIDPDTGQFKYISVIQQGTYAVPICNSFKEIIRLAGNDPTDSHPECYFQVMTWQYIGTAYMCWQMNEQQKKHFGFK